MDSITNDKTGGGDSLDEVVGRLQEELEEKSDRLTSLVRTITAIASTDDLDSVLQVVGFETARFISFDKIAVVVIERSRGVYRVAASSGMDSVHVGPTGGDGPGAYLLAGSAVEWVAEQRQPVVRDRLESVAGAFPEEKHLYGEGMRSCCIVPMVGRDGAMGALFLVGRTEQTYDRDDVNFLELIAEQLCGAVERREHLGQLRRRHGELAIINEIGRKTMAQFDMIDVLDSVAASIQRYLGYYDVNLFLVDDTAGDVVLMAEAGAQGERTSVGYRQKVGVGLVGACAASGETVLANDAALEPRRVIAFPIEAEMGAELCVPIKAGDNVMGVINVQCKEKGSFQDDDVSTIKTFASQIAQTIENARLYEETRSLKELNENIIANMPAALAVVDTDMHVQVINDTFCRLRGRSKDELVGQDVGELFAGSFLREGGLAEAIRAAIDSGRPAAMPNVKGVLAPAVTRLFNLHVSSVGIGTQPCAMIMLEDITQTVEHAYQLSMLRQINETVQTTLDLKRLFRLVLTCTTSGHALGFNRAILLMVDKATNSLEGRLAIGPKDQEDAFHIWQRINAENKTFKELLRDADDGRPDEEMPLYHVAAQLKYPLDSDELVVRCVRERQSAVVADASNDDRVGEHFRSVVRAGSFVVVPLVAKDEAVGAIVADSLYSGEPVSNEKVELLGIFANHVGLAIENAEAYDALHKQINKLQEAYRELRETQGKLVQSEKLAAIGEVAAHVAHEIRNPLVTIGGFARNIKRQLPESDAANRSVGIIIEEVTRLEKILANVMDFSKPSAPWKRPTKINQVVHNTRVLVAGECERLGIELTEDLADDLPLVMVDGEQLKQALLNIMKNALESITDGGRIAIASRLERETVRIDITDSGKGIAEDMLPNLFDPFFTTRPDGTGLGLAVTRKIVVDHGGDIEVKSKLGLGTTFTIRLPVETKARARRRTALPDKISTVPSGPPGDVRDATPQGGSL